MTKYHAHVCFDAAEAYVVEKIRGELLQVLPPLTSAKPLHLSINGPFPKPMFEIEFDGSVLGKMKALLATYYQGRSIMIHPVHDDELTAHTSKAEWLGQPLEIRTGFF